MAIYNHIVPYQANKSTAIVQPKQSLSAIVPAQKEAQKKQRSLQEILLQHSDYLERDNREID